MEEIYWKKILICNQGPLEEVFFATFLIPVLHRKFPECQIGMVVDPSCSRIAKRCSGVDPGVDIVHEFEMVHQKNETIEKKFIRVLSYQFKQKREWVDQLAKEKYEIAIHLNPQCSTMIPLCQKAKIPLQVGFDQGEYQHLLTHLVSWESGLYLPDQYLRVLEKMGIAKEYFSSFQSPWIQPAILNQPSSKLDALPEVFIIFHIGAKENETSIVFWRSLLEKFKMKGYRVFFTGHGENENSLIDQICSFEQENLCNAFTWKEWLQVLNKAQLIVTVDCLALHIAAAMKKPFIALSGQFPDPNIGLPKFENGEVFVGKQDVGQVYDRAKRLIEIQQVPVS